MKQDRDVIKFDDEQLPLYNLPTNQLYLLEVDLEGEMLLVSSGGQSSTLVAYLNKHELWLKSLYANCGLTFNFSEGVYRRLAEQLSDYLPYQFPSWSNEMVASLQGLWQQHKGKAVTDLLLASLGMAGLDMKAFMLYHGPRDSNKLYLLDISTLYDDGSECDFNKLSKFFLFHSNHLAQLTIDNSLGLAVMMDKVIEQVGDCTSDGLFEQERRSVNVERSMKRKKSKELLKSSKSITIEADEAFESQQYIIEKDIQEHIDKLKRSGFEHLLLKLVVANFGTASLQKVLQSTVVKPSPLKVNAKHQLLLPAFNNKEIKLTPLVKTVYLFFLKHPDGVVFKRLPKFKQELMDLYLQVQPTGDLIKMRASIEDLANPFQNSINEKCSRIKGEVLKMMPPELAKYYYVISGRGGKKYIPIARENAGELLSWDKTLQ